ncbi:recombinase B (plasmid) [Legionella adelaidensis]|uniref:Recombinase B n=1 Tax=Legionella adelaidensis TaxID=45056 RepID=A0A0W0R3C1_9GAMM|nr:PD-(D/E)XK nuclease family protein [Legionella adelaidensis]KTC65538.1 recombinase B [Legionella adelaidensis]VEH84641.1 recombinase B [Legionella adelaidensis]
MAENLNNKAALLQELEKGAIVVTPNKRLSQHFLQSYIQQKKISKKPLCFSYHSFLHFLYKKVRHQLNRQAHPILLSKLQQLFLWQQIIGNGEPIPKGLLLMVAETWKRFHYWQLSINHPSFLYNNQTSAYHNWHKQFEKELRRHNALTEEELGNYLGSFLSQIKVPAMIIWACFDDFTPQQQALQKILENAGCSHKTYELTAIPSYSYQFAASDKEHELTQLIHWAKEQLNTQKCVGIVVPELHLQAQRFHREFLRHFKAEDFNISYAQPLIEFPLIAHALEFLNLNKIVTRQTVQHLLKSPYLKGAHSEFIARAELADSNQLLQEETVTSITLIASCEKTAPVFSEIIKKLTPYPLEAPLNEWVFLFKQRLAEIGFPGEYALNSECFQYYKKFLQLVDEFTTLSFLHEKITREQALDYLQLLVENTAFQPEKNNAPLQILGILEASGCTFDKLWVSGLTLQSLLQGGKTTPFINSSLQREKKMPFADPVSQVELMDKLLKRLQNSSSTNIFSYPSLVDDIPQMPSHFLVNLPLLDFEAVEEKFSHSLIERKENYFLPLINEETIIGGTAILANQAKCPFRAFAAHRLHAYAKLESFAGLNPLQRGQIIHRVMENIWKKIESQTQLNALSPPLLETLIEETIQTSLAPLNNENRVSFSPVIQEIETIRLKKLVYGCIEWEKQRPAFTIEALEQSFTINIAGVEFKVRVDRLDKVENTKWLIDYKSSLPSQKPWYEERPEEPQLLLYALLDNSINALLFLQIKTGKIECQGISQDFIDLQGLKPLKEEHSWINQREVWRENLTRLVQEFTSGYCAPLPSRESICSQCEYSSLCRKAY